MYIYLKLKFHGTLITLMYDIFWLLSLLLNFLSKLVIAQQFEFLILDYSLEKYCLSFPGKVVWSLLAWHSGPFPALPLPAKWHIRHFLDWPHTVLFLCLAFYCPSPSAHPILFLFLSLGFYSQAYVIFLIFTTSG